jgi:hypothetical protein
MNSGAHISRREFLKLLQTSTVTLALPLNWLEYFSFPPLFPSINLNRVPEHVRKVLMQVSPAQIDQAGYLALLDTGGSPKGRVALARTRWNLERHFSYDRLVAGKPWGIVLHWYSDKDNFDRSISGYLRGFNELRMVDNYETRTSAHFLVGKEKPDVDDGEPIQSIGIIQTQAPDKDGIPFLASHLQPINFLIHKEKKQYFVRALYQLAYAEPAIHSILQDFYDGPRIDPNMDTIAVEITGHDFDSPSSCPDDQQIANVVSVVWAVMKRYRISALNIMGHHEIQINKSDPGKKFITLIRYLIGLKALYENDQVMKQLVFGQFYDLSGDTSLAVQKYFKFIRDYLVLVSYPYQVFEWETVCRFFNVYDDLFDHAGAPMLDGYLAAPVDGNIRLNGGKFLEPENHEGIDLYCDSSTMPTKVHLISEGVCIYTGTSKGYHPGKTAIFRHHLPQGAEIITVFSHLSSLGDLSVGEKYAQGYPIGFIEDDNKQRFLHFAAAYGATWETDLKNCPDIPANVGATWIKFRYLNPGDYIKYNNLTDNKKK